MHHSSALTGAAPQIDDDNRTTVKMLVESLSTQKFGGATNNQQMMADHSVISSHMSGSMMVSANQFRNQLGKSASNFIPSIASAPVPVQMSSQQRHTPDWQAQNSVLGRS